MNPTWQNSIDKLPQLAPKFDLVPQKTALMIVDMQYLDAHPSYGIGLYLKEKYPQVHSHYFGRLAQTVVPNNIKLLTFFRKHQLRIIYLALGSMLPDASDLTPLRKQRESGLTILHWVGDFEYNILEELKPQKGELVMHKTGSSGFNSSPIDQTLRNMGIECLLITGVVTFACVQLTALDAADRGYRTVIIEDAVAGYDHDHHDAALRIFASVYGRVASTKEICAELDTLC